MSRPSIVASEVSVFYRTRRSRFIPGFGLFGDHRPNSNRNVRQWALRDVSVTCRPGECVGVVGHNGAGKTSLIRVLNGTLDPSSGNVEAIGRISGICSIGMGFNGRLSGIENIFVRAALEGRLRSEVREKLDSIVSFSGLGDRVLDPIDSYSTGMRLRLGFAVATAFEPEILLLDEWIAAGDVEFKTKANDRLRQMVDAAKIFVIASHSLPLLQELCSRTIWLEEGRIRTDGPTDEIVDEYRQARKART